MPRVSTVLATGCTLAVIGLSMAMNFAFGYGLGTNETNARILGALSVACDGLKALLPLIIAWQWAEGRRLAAAAGACLFVLLLAYGGASAIGFAAENRTAFAGGRETLNAALEVARTDLAAAEAKLAALPESRLAGVIAAELAALRQDRVWTATSGCTNATLAASREVCKHAEALRGEQTIAAEAAALTATIERLKHEIVTSRQAGAGREADPQAQAIAALTGLDPSLVRSGFAWLLAIAVEAISAFGLFAIWRQDAIRPAPPRPAGPMPIAIVRQTPDLEAIAPASGWRLAKAG